MRPARLRSGARQAGSAEGLHTYDGADHIAIDVGIADRSVLEHLSPEGLQAGLHPQGQAVMARTNRLQNLHYVGGSIAHDMQDGPEFLARELRRALQLDEMRCEETAVGMRLAEA